MGYTSEKLLFYSAFQSFFYGMVTLFFSDIERGRERWDESKDSAVYGMYVAIK